MIASLIINLFSQLLLALKTVILEKIKKEPQSIQTLFDDLNEKDQIPRHTIRGRLSELRTKKLIKKEGDLFKITSQ